MHPPKYDPSILGIRPGSRVAHRGTGRPIGEVDTLGEGDGQRWAIVSWPAVGHPAAPTDRRGRRGQVFDLTALTVIDHGPPDPQHPQSPRPDPQEE